MPFTAFALLAPVTAHLRVWGCGLEALAIHTPRGGRELTALVTALSLAPCLPQLRPTSRRSPAFAIGRDGIPLPELPGEPAPLTARLEQIPNPLAHTPQVARRTPRPARSPFPGWEQRQEQCPLRRRQIRWRVSRGAQWCLLLPCVGW